MAGSGKEADGQMRLPGHRVAGEAILRQRNRLCMLRRSRIRPYIAVESGRFRPPSISSIDGFSTYFHAVIEKSSAVAFARPRAGDRRRSKVLAIDCVTRYHIPARQPPLPI